MPEERATLIVAVKDEATAALAKVGAGGAKAGNDLNKGLSGAIKAATGLDIASIGLVGGLTALGAGLAYSVKQAAESERVMAKTAAVIKSTGGAAGLTSDQIGSMADRLSQLSAIDDEAIQGAENLLLTFKSVKANAFEPATQAAIDLSVAFKMDLHSSIMMVGKALEDPIRGITSLRRAGVTFTEDQKKLIKSLVETGQSAKAQEIILAELNSQVGGSGAAAAKTYSGQMALLKINLDNVAESVGMRLLPGLTALAAKMNETVTVQSEYDKAIQAGILSEREIAQIRVTDLFGLRDQGLAIIHNAEAQAALSQKIDDHAEALSADSTVVYAATGAYDGMIDKAIALEAAQANVTASTALESSMMGELTGKMIFQTAAAGENSAAQLEIARAMGLVDEKTLSSIEKVQALKQNFDDGTITLSNYAYQLGLIKNGIDGLNDKTVTVTVNTNYQQYGTEPGPPGVIPPGPDDTIIPPPGGGGGGMQFASHGSSGGNGGGNLAAALNSLPGAIARAVRDGMQMAR